MSSTDGRFVSSGWRTNSVRSRSVETVQQNGREYLQFPLVALTEMVYEYPEQGTSEYLPAEHIRGTAQAWAGVPLVFRHPRNRQQTVRDPDAFMGDVIGAFHNPHALNGGEKLTGTGLIDVEKAKALGGSAAELVELLRNGEEVSVSAGYATTEDDHRGGRFGGKAYDLVQGAPLLPDHIAIFPSDSQMRARCSPEDGCAAPRANAHQYQLQDGQPANQRATNENGVRANMSETGTASDAGTTEEQRQMTDELRAMFDEVESSGVPTDAQTKELRRLRNVTDGLGRVLENESADVSPALEVVVEESKALVADMLSDSQHDEGTSPATTQGDEKTNAGSCECGGVSVCTCDRPFTSGSDGDGTGESLPNMAAVPGGASRDLDADRGRERENADAYPAGGRRAWEARQVGLSDVEADDDLPPAGGRSNWEARKQKARANAEQAAAETPTSAAARRSLTARQNAVEASEWRAAEYPLSAKRHAEERAEKRQRQAELKDLAKRNDVPLHQRRTDS